MCKNINSNFPLQTSSSSSDWDSFDWASGRSRAVASAEILQKRQEQLHGAELHR